VASSVPAAEPTGKNSSPIRRRVFIGSSLGLGLSVLAAPGAAAATSPIPPLPGEVSRTTRLTPRGVPYDNITVNISGDPAQLFVPHTAIPKQTRVGVVWYYHANGSTHTSLNGVYRYSAELLVDQGAVCYCPNYGGSLWTNTESLAYHARAVAYLKAVFNIGVSFLRGNSGGGSLMCWAYGKSLVPAARGMYLANATYDMVDLYTRDPVRIGPVYDNDITKVRATNPAGLPGSVWTGKRIRVVVSDDAHPDPIVPPHKHGLALVAKSNGYAVENSVLYHQLGHHLPDVANRDMLVTFNRWLRA
jgi:hypothetical protein